MFVSLWNKRLFILYMYVFHVCFHRVWTAVFLHCTTAERGGVRLPREGGSHQKKRLCFWVNMTRSWVWFQKSGRVRNLNCDSLGAFGYLEMKRLSPRSCGSAENQETVKQHCRDRNWMFQSKREDFSSVTLNICSHYIPGNVLVIPGGLYTFTSGSSSECLSVILAGGAFSF